jgi:hypothetical protein
MASSKEYLIQYGYRASGERQVLFCMVLHEYKLIRKKIKEFYVMRLILMPI